MYVGLKQPRGDGERYVTPARAAAKETTFDMALRQTAKVKLLASVFSCLFGRLKIVVFGVNSSRRFSIFV